MAEEDLGPQDVLPLKVLLRSSESCTLSDTGQAFLNLYNEGLQRARGLKALALLLQHVLVKQLAQRIAAYYLIAFTFDWSDLASFPFLRFFVEAAGSESVAREERALLQALLRNGPASLESAQPLELAEHLWREPATLLSLPELVSRYGPFSTSASPVPAVLAEPKAAPAPAAAPAALEPAPGVTSGCSEQRAPEGAAPSRQLRAPPIMALQPSEAAWVPLPLQDTLVWDDSAEVLPSTLQHLQKLVVQAQSKPLAPFEQKRLLAALEAWPRLVHHIGVSPVQLPALIEHNNMVAVELLLKLIDVGSPRVGAFLDVLVRMDLSVHSMEVVKRLTGVVSLPSDFLHLYIASCIQSCESIEHKNLQNRLVRLVCVFLQSLIRTKVLDARAAQYELLSFCVNFSRIREAASLFRLLQNLQDADGSTSPGPGDSDAA